MSAPSREQALLDLFDDRNRISYRPPLARMLGSASAALFLSQAIYWQKKAGAGKWFYKLRDAERTPDGRMLPPSRADRQSWEWETGLTRSEQESARDKLRRLGILGEQRRAGNRLHFLVDVEQVIKVYNDFLIKNQEIEESRLLESEGEIQPSRRQDRPVQKAESCHPINRDYSKTTQTPPGGAGGDSNDDDENKRRTRDRLEELLDAAEWGEQQAKRPPGANFRRWKRGRLMRNGASSQDWSLHTKHRTAHAWVIEGLPDAYECEVKSFRTGALLNVQRQRESGSGDTTD